MARIITRLVDLIRSEGPIATVHKVISSIRARIMRASDQRWECRNQIKTLDEMNLDVLNIEQSKKKHGFTYVPSFCRLTHNLIWNIEKELESTPYLLSDFIFIDYGSGKGQALMAAAEYSFSEIIGVEFSNELHQIAEQNLIQFSAQHPQAPPMRSVNMDATDFDIPNAPCVLYFYNPFDEFVMAKILKKLEQRQSVSSNPAYIVYAQLRNEDPYHTTKNISLISGLGNTIKIDVAYRSLFERFLLGSHLLTINYLGSERG